MDELAVLHNALPSTIEELTKYVLIGREKLTAVRAEIRAIDRLKLADEVRGQKLAEAQHIAEVVLDAEMRVGELLREIPAERGGDRRSVDFKSTSDDTFETPKQQTRADLGISKQQAIRYMTLAGNRPILEQAKAEARERGDIVSRSLALELIKAAEREAARNAIITTVPKPFTGLYNVILSDCPWQYEFSETESRAIENHYPTMSIDELKALEIPADDDAVLFIWATAPKLVDALEVMSAWGFEYKTCGVWDKEKIGMGYWLRGRHELLLIGVKGDFKPPAPETRVSSIYSERRGEHSAKPTYYNDLIERMFPDGRYLELFARQQYNERWDVWGNQI